MMNLLVKTITVYPTLITDSRNHNSDSKIIAYERFLRKTAYKNTVIKINDSFFDDSDMQSIYYLCVIWDEDSNTPLLSCRYFYDQKLIKRYMQGDFGIDIPLNYDKSIFELNSYEQESIFLADRLSGNINSVIYRNNRNQLFSLLYHEIRTNNNNKTMLLMVREDLKNKQIQRYLKLGFLNLGSVLHKNKMHAVLLLNINSQ